MVRGSSGRREPGRRHVAPLSGFGVFSLSDGRRRLGWCQRDHVVECPRFASLEEVFALGRSGWETTVERVADGRDVGEAHALAAVTMHLPFAVADFVDFYTSLEHAAAVGRRFRPGGEPLQPNWRHMPVGYHGRAGSVFVSGTDIVRPSGHVAPGIFAPTSELDVEVELGYVIGAGATTFDDAVFGIVCLNDWSARDIQAFESPPLGPFLGKSFATSISAWVTPLALLDAARTVAPPQDPQPLPHLRLGRDSAFDVELELEINRDIVSHCNARTLYWTGPQLVAHLTSNGSHLRPGDILATGTISAPEPGSLLEIGRAFLADGDEVVIRGRAAEHDLGEVRGRVLPATAGTE